MEKCSIKKCYYEYEERYISDRITAGWGDMLFELWIDRWAFANYLLPDIYDKAKAEAIKTETNLSELFGSVERMIEFHSAGLYTREIFKKYKNSWSYVSEIPVDDLEMIANDDYEGALRSVIVDFEEAISNQKFEKAWWLLSANHWLNEYYDRRTYNVVVLCFNQYRRDMMRFGISEVFKGCCSIDDILRKYSN